MMQQQRPRTQPPEVEVQLGDMDSETLCQLAQKFTQKRLQGHMLSPFEKSVMEEWNRRVDPESSIMGLSDIMTDDLDSVAANHDSNHVRDKNYDVLERFKRDPQALAEYEQFKHSQSHHGLLPTHIMVDS